MAMNHATVFESWGRLIARRRRLVLVIAALAAAVGLVWGTGVFGHLQTAGGFTAPGSQSQQAGDLATGAFGRDAGDVVVVYSSATETVKSPAFRTAVVTSLSHLSRAHVASSATYWSTGSPSFIATGGHETYAVVELSGADDAARQVSYDAIKAHLGAPGLVTRVGGLVPTDETINNQTTKDIRRAESLSFPILLILLLFIFGSLTAAGLPLAIGAMGILGSFTALRLLTLFTSVSIFSANITTILGLGLAIDYGLFMVTRFREELQRQESVPDAVARTMGSAGRTVLFSGVTVAVALATLLLFPESFLRSMGYGGVLTVLVDMAAALTVMPALLATLGPKVNSLSIRRRTTLAPAAAGRWYHLAARVMRRPAVVTGVIVVVLVGLGSPFLKVAWGGTDATVLPAAATPRLVTDTLSHDFPGNPTAPVEALVQFTGPVTSSPQRTAALDAYVGRLSRVPGVGGAQVTGIHGDVARIDMGYGPGPNSPQAEAIVHRVRAVAGPTSARVFIGGQTAQLVDTLHSLSGTLPWMLLAIVLATFVMLFLAFGSVILPIKAVVMNILSLSVMYGVLVWVFQEGHLSRWLHFTANGTINPTTPILMFAIMFGLSMDYEVFLLSRIREAYVESGDNTTAIATGLERTGGIITSAALLLIVVVGPFALSGVTFTKMLGVGMIVALVVDATLIRILLVPATMKLLGDANWWAPAPLRRLYDRVAIREDSGDEPTSVVELDVRQPVAV
jgi:uncharacterized membrane protein YdfJ with MMPL/SSD domain